MFFSSLRRINYAAVVCSVGLILSMATLSVVALRQITRQTSADVESLQQGTTLGSTLVSAVLTQIGAAEEYLTTPSPAVKAEFIANGDSAYMYQARLRDLPHFDAADRRLVNLVATTQATALDRRQQLRRAPLAREGCGAVETAGAVVVDAPARVLGDQVRRRHGAPP